MHVDDFIWTRFGENKYARWVLMHFRMPAAVRLDFQEFMKDHELFCTWKGERYRVTGASRFGDVWLHSDFNEDTTYEHRVEVEECTEWGPKP